MCKREARNRMLIEGHDKRMGVSPEPLGSKPKYTPGSQRPVEHADSIPVEILTDDERKLRLCLRKKVSEEIRTVEPERTHIKCGSFEFISDGVCRGRVMIDGHEVPRVRKVVLTSTVDDLAILELHILAVFDNRFIPAEEGEK